MGIQEAICTCPYDWGGDCKHIIALLLTYLNRQEDFSRRVSLDELLNGLDRDAILALLKRLLKSNPDLYDEIELALPAVSAHQPTPPGVAAIKIAATQVSEQACRKQVRRILKHNSDEEHYDGWGEPPAYLEDLEKVQQTAEQLLVNGDAKGAMIILRVLLEETLDDYDSDLDYDGYIAAFIQDLGMPLAEAILSVSLDDAAWQELQTWVDELLDDVDSDFIELDELEIIRVALEYGWKDLPETESELESVDEEEQMLLYDLQQVKLDVLEHQGRIDEFLKLSEDISPLRYMLKLIDLGQVDKAIAACRSFKNDDDIYPIVKRLYEKGYQDEALGLAEHHLISQGRISYHLAAWLAPIEETLNRKDLALVAYKSVFFAQPSLGIYQKVKHLAGLEWEKIRPELLQVIASANSNLRASIHLEEHEWDAAIRLAEKDAWNYTLLAEVADAVIHHRPDWVICVALNQSDDLIVKTQSKLYPVAAQWLKRARQAYYHKGQAAEWQAYITNLRATYARRPALQQAIAGL